MPPKSIAKGKLFDGLADCYNLSDGRRVLSQRGAVKALTGGGRKASDFGTYLARLPEEFAIKGAGANFEFELDDGTVAHGIEAKTFVKFLHALVAAGLGGALRKNQLHLTVVLAYMKDSTAPDEFFAKLAHFFAGDPLQENLWRHTRAKKRAA